MRSGFEYGLNLVFFYSGNISMALPGSNSVNSVFWCHCLHAWMHVGIYQIRTSAFSHCCIAATRCGRLLENLILYLFSVISVLVRICFVCLPGGGCINSEIKIFIRKIGTVNFI